MENKPLSATARFCWGRVRNDQIGGTRRQAARLAESCDQRKAAQVAQVSKRVLEVAVIGFVFLQPEPVR